MDDGIRPLRFDSRERRFRRSGTGIEMAPIGAWQGRPLVLAMEIQNSGSERSLSIQTNMGGRGVQAPAVGCIPTAFSVVAIKQLTVCNRSEASENRLGVEMLLDRVCVGGGWNSGNSVVYGAPLSPHVEATAIALLALQVEPRREIVRASVNWLESRAAGIDAVSSLSWCILTLFVYQRRPTN